MRKFILTGGLAVLALVVCSLPFSARATGCSKSLAATCKRQCPGSSCPEICVGECGFQAAGIEANLQVAKFGADEGVTENQIEAFISSCKASCEKQKRASDEQKALCKEQFCGRELMIEMIKGLQEAESQQSAQHRKDAKRSSASEKPGK